MIFSRKRWLAVSALEYPADRRFACSALAVDILFTN
jgi:hypothetical protein